MKIYGTGKKNLPKGKAYDVIPSMAAVLVKNGSASYEVEESIPSEMDDKEKVTVEAVTEKVKVSPTKKKKKNGK